VINEGCAPCITAPANCIVAIASYERFQLLRIAVVADCWCRRPWCRRADLRGLRLASNAMVLKADFRMRRSLGAVRVSQASGLWN
jgi:hypothetical protein